MDFYFGRSSGNSSRTAFALHEAGVAYKPHPLHVPDGESRTDAYLALNPMGKVPTLVDGTVRLWESNAINWYVAEKHPEARLLPPSIAGRAAVHRWLFFQVGHVTPACVQLFRGSNSRHMAFWRIKADPVMAEAGRKELSRYLPVLDAALADREWLEGDFSLADIAYAPHLWMVGDSGYDFSATPHLRAWLDRLLARPAWLRSRKLIFDI
jgi:GST-like protein